MTAGYCGLLTLPVVGILVVCDVQPFHLLGRIQAEGLLLGLYLFGKSTRRVNVAIMLQELKDLLGRQLWNQSWVEVMAQAMLTYQLLDELRLV
jgi:hypothetical protein